MENKNMTPARRDYPVADSPFWLHVEFLVQRAGAVVLLLIVLAAVCGVFSQGWLSEKTATSRDHQLTAHYDRFGRLMSDGNMQLTVNTSANSAVIALGGEFMRHYEIRTLQPQPSRMYSQGSELVLEYARADAEKPLTVWLGLTPLSAGSSTQYVTLNGDATLTMKTFIWP